MKKLTFYIFLYFSFLILLSFFACKKKESESTPPQKKQGSHFVVKPHSHKPFQSYPKNIGVFDINIYGTDEVEDNKLVHAAEIMAQYLDNDEDGMVDNEKVHNAMLDNNATILMWKTENDLLLTLPDNYAIQDLGADETILEWHENNHQGQFDATLEEVLHLITSSGYAHAYPNVFGENPNSVIADAMNTARGGVYTDVLEDYPANAWYTYYDTTCDYSCMVTEYFYWSLTSLLGAQANRENEIQNEWKLHTSDAFRNEDIKMYEILSNKSYRLPTVLPDGSYQR